MSLLLSQVGAPPPPATVTWAGRVQATQVDSGQIELRGVIRVGLVVAVAVAPVTFAARIGGLLPPVEQLSGRVVSVAPPQVRVPVQTRATGLPSDPLLSGRVSPGFAPPAVVPQVVWAPSIRSVVLPDVELPRPSRTVGWSVSAPPVAVVPNPGDAVPEVQAASAVALLVSADVRAEVQAAEGSAVLLAARADVQVASASVSASVVSAVAHDATLYPSGGATITASDAQGGLL